MKKHQIVEITKMAVVVALIALLGLTPVGYIMVGNLQITTVHIAVIVITLTLGLKLGIIAGLTFGITSMITALTVPNLFSPIFYNPIVSVLPRVLLPISAYYIYKFMNVVLMKMEKGKVKTGIASGVSAALATLIHTLLVVALIWVFRGMSPEMTSEMLNISLVSILAINLPTEMISAVIVSSLIVPILAPYFQKKKSTEK